MRTNKEIDSLFRNRLLHTEMTVRDGFWEELQRELPQDSVQKPWFMRSSFHRMAAAASVLLVLGVVSAAFWYFSPQEEIKDAFIQMEQMPSEGALVGDRVQETLPSLHTMQAVVNTQPKRHQSLPVGQSATAPVEEEEEGVSVSVSITITQRVYGNPKTSYRASQTAVSQNIPVGNGDASPESESAVKHAQSALPRPRNWAMKAAVGTALPKGDCQTPFSALFTLERRLNNRLALEAGLQYNLLPSEECTLHTLAVPVKLDATLAANRRMDFYATVGGAVEKCVAGAPDNGFRAEPLQLSLIAGLGLRYRMNDRFALFAEPALSYHFDTDSANKSLRSERPLNLNLLCGVRMNY
ncbi:MAG: porin family protein [Mediterranea sp.]|nr:porin family protein [Mediterranea sp.]